MGKGNDSQGREKKKPKKDAKAAPVKAAPPFTPPSRGRPLRLGLGGGNRVGGGGPFVGGSRAGAVGRGGGDAAAGTGAP